MQFRKTFLSLAAAIAVSLTGCNSGTTSSTTNSGPVTPSIVWATPAAVAAGTVLGATQLNATAIIPGTSIAVPGTFAYTPAAGAVLSAGSQTLSATFTPYAPSTYNTATATVTLTVNKVTPTIVWPTPGPVTVGTALSGIQYNATAMDPNTGAAVPGSFAYTPSLGTVESATGTQPLTAAFTPSDLTHYTSASATVQLTVSAGGTPAYTFKNVQIIGGGYITGIIPHPAQKGLMYARTDVGGAYRYDSTNSETGIESIGLDPNDPQRLYLAAGLYTQSYGAPCVLLNSHDQGATFTSYTFPFKCGGNNDGRGAGERLVVDPNLSSVVYFGSRLNGLWRSVDTGSTWQQVTTFPVTAGTSGAGIVFEIFVKSSSASGNATKTIYAGVSATGTGNDPASLYVSNDAGVSWSAVPGAPTGLYVNHGLQGADGKLYFSLADQIGPNNATTGKILQYVLPSSSAPNGTWNDITPPRASGYQGGYGGLALDPEAPGTIMVSTLDHYYPLGDDLWRSTNYGTSWYSINTVGAVRNVSLSPWVLFGASSLVSTSNWPTALAIDPYNSAHVLHGNGQTILTTSDMTDSDANKPSQWTIGALGIEETVVNSLISPPAGPANLLSGVSDLGGFQHTDLTKSPAAGAFANPGFGNASSLDFAQSLPADMVRVGSGSANQFGAYSTDYGTTWKPFATNPTGTTSGSGTVALSADGKTIVWAPGDSTAVTAYSTDNGTTWTASSGAPKNLPVFSDRVNPKTFYLYDRNAGTVYSSNDSGATFTALLSGVAKYGVLNVAYDAEGSLYLASPQGLYHASKGATFAQLSSVQSAFAIAEGAPRTNSAQLTLYIGGQVGGVSGIFRSTDAGVTWIRVDDAAHEFGYIDVIQGDPRVFGRVYLGTGGRGIVYADSPY